MDGESPSPPKDVKPLSKSRTRDHQGSQDDEKWRKPQKSLLISFFFFSFLSLCFFFASLSFYLSAGSTIKGRREILQANQTSTTLNTTFTLNLHSSLLINAPINKVNN
ncbi:hypothetical protein Dimus_039060 [Dionaea muscipula]